MHKHSTVILLSILVVFLSVYIFLENRVSPDSRDTSESISAEQPVQDHTRDELKKVRIISSSMISGNKPPVIISNLDGSDKKVIPEGEYTVDAYNVTVRGYNADRMIWLRDASGDFTQLASFEHVKGITGWVVLAPDASSVVYLKQDAQTGKHQLWQETIATQKSILLYGNLEQFGRGSEFKYIRPFAFSADGQKVYLEYRQSSSQSYSGLQDGMYVLDIASKKMKFVQLMAADENIQHLILSPDHTKLAVVAGSPGTAIHIYDFATEKKTTYDVDSYPATSESFGWSPDGTKFGFVSFPETENNPQSNGIFHYINVVEGKVYAVGAPKEGIVKFFWLNNKDVLYGYQIYGNYGEGVYWKFGTVLFDTELKTQTEMLKDINLWAVIPVR
jgi:hypothetical protein